MNAYFIDGPLAATSRNLCSFERRAMTVTSGIHQYFPVFEGSMAGLPICVMTVRFDMDERDLINMVEEVLTIQLSGSGQMDQDAQSVLDKTTLLLDSGIMNTWTLSAVRILAMVNSRLMEIQYESRNRDQHGRPTRHSGGVPGVSD